VFVGAEWAKIVKNPDDLTVTNFALEGSIQGEGAIPVGDLKLKITCKFGLSGTAGPNWPRIAEEAAKQGVETAAEDAAVAGGAEATGAAAVAAAPIVGGIVGGVALTAGVCADLASWKIWAGTPRTSLHKEHVNYGNKPSLMDRPCVANQAAMRRATRTPRPGCRIS
jgi:hypothetical protein